MKKQFSLRSLTGFSLKIIAMISMTFDHLGIFVPLIDSPSSSVIADIFRAIGRLALPLFIFLISEGVRHTKNEKKYLLRLGILASTYLIGQLFIYLLAEEAITSPIIDLLLTAITLILLKRKDKFSFFAILPIAFSILTFVIINVNPNIKWVPFILRPDYSLFSMLLGLGFYYAKPISIFLLKNNPNTANLVDTSYQRYAESIISAIFVVVLSGIFYITFLTLGVSYSVIPAQIFAMLSCIPILFYSGKRGYNAKWFQIGCYIYVPTHLILIAIPFLLICL